MQPVLIAPQGGHLSSNIESGDRLKLVTHNGKEFLITVSAVTDSSIISQDTSFQLSDLTSIERSELTIVGKAGIYVGAAILVFATFELIEELIKILFVDPKF